MFEKQTYSLLELNEQIKRSIKNAFSGGVWVQAEINELRENANGICYLELTEKGESDYIVAKQSAIIWASTYRKLKPYFESTTGIALQNGIKILVRCSIEFHEVYGMSLYINDIEPSYTVGDLALRRAKIIEQLRSEGILEMNKELILSDVPQRIAIISSPTAAGYGDFRSQIEKNVFGFKFYTKLFPATMQGQQVENSIIGALDKIYEQIDFFDVVVIIRGGGATSDLSAFDNYNLAAHVAQFPLPIISGIGHQRDSSIVDLVAFRQENTPTAVAEFLIKTINESFSEAEFFFNRIVDTIKQRFQNEKINVEMLSQKMFFNAKNGISLANDFLNILQIKIKNSAENNLNNEKHQLKQTEEFIKWNNPQTIINKGFSLTLKDGKIVKSAKQLQKGDLITTLLSDGKKESIVK